jgi:hypothetical protein
VAAKLDKTDDVDKPAGDRDGRGRLHKLTADPATLNTLHQYGELQYTVEEVAAALKVHVTTLRDFFRREAPAVEAFEMGRSHGRVQVRQAFYRMAHEHPRMWRFWAKLYLGR